MTINDTLDERGYNDKPDGRKLRFGPKNTKWKGGKHITTDGYVMVLNRGHPNAENDGYMREHRLVMSEHLGRPLLKSETVHHKNGNKQDNRIENLELWSKSQPYGQRVEDKLKWAKEIIALYERDFGNS